MFVRHRVSASHAISLQYTHTHILTAGELLCSCHRNCEQTFTHTYKTSPCILCGINSYFLPAPNRCVLCNVCIYRRMCVYVCVCLQKTTQNKYSPSRSTFAWLQKTSNDDAVKVVASVVVVVVVDASDGVHACSHSHKLFNIKVG